MGTPIFAITDGTTRVNLLTKAGSGINACNYEPGRPTFKDDGVWANSSLSDGRQLQMRKWTNIVDVLFLTISGNSQDKIIQDSRNLTMLLEKAVYYWTTEWQNEPVWIERRGSEETNISYSLIHSYKWEGDKNPFVPPFYVPSKPYTMHAISLAIEHGAWLSNPPGENECVEISNIMDSSGPLLTFTPSISDDDAYVDNNAGTITAGATTLIVGAISSYEYGFGVRFRNVTIPVGATITGAFLVLTPPSTTDLESPVTDVYGELNATPSAFTTYANYAGRARTTNYVAWTLPLFSAAIPVYSPDIADVVQEIVDLVGWASGNDMVIFCEYVQPPRGGFRYAASWDSPTYDEPTLVIYYTTSEPTGRTSTCSDEVYVSNKDNKAGLTNIYHYDTSAAVFSANLLTAALPYEIYPNPLGNGDICYFGSTEGTFSSLIFDIGVNAGSASIAWQYWNGAAWAVIPAADMESDVGSQYIEFEVSGVGGIIWVIPDDWATTAINGITAYWVRAVTSSPTMNVVTQQNRQIYTVTSSGVTVSGDSISGDIPALAKINVTTLDTDRGKAEKIIIGTRSLDRGSDFTQHINVDGQNHVLIFNNIFDAFTTQQTNISAPSDSVLRTVFPASPDAWERKFRIGIESPLAQEYYGRYRAFMRGIETTAIKHLSDGDILSYLDIELGSSNRTKSVGNIGIDDDWYYFDYGIITIPPALIPNTYSSNTVINVYAINQNANSITFDWVDLILIPIDEYAIEIRQDPTAIKSTKDTTIIDSTSYIGKRNIFTALWGGGYNYISDVPLAIAPEPVQLQAEADQKIYFFVPDASKYEWLGRIQVWKNERYITFRGDS